MKNRMSDILLRVWAGWTRIPLGFSLRVSLLAVRRRGCSPEDRRYNERITG